MRLYCFQLVVEDRCWLTIFNCSYYVFQGFLRFLRLVEPGFGFQQENVATVDARSSTHVVAVEHVVAWRRQVAVEDVVGRVFPICLRCLILACYAFPLESISQIWPCHLHILSLILHQYSVVCQQICYFLTAYPLHQPPKLTIQHHSLPTIEAPNFQASTVLVAHALYVASHVATHLEQHLHIVTHQILEIICQWESVDHLLVLLQQCGVHKLFELWNLSKMFLESPEGWVQISEAVDQFLIPIEKEWIHNIIMGSCINTTATKPVYIVKHPKDIEVSCKICFNNYNGTDKIPMVMSCGHGICSPCLNSLTKNTCPFDRTTIDKTKAYKNMEMMQLISDLEENQKKQSQSNDKEPLCHKNHPTFWTGMEKQCKVCLEMGGGWQCQPCDFHMCTKCSGFNRKAGKTCFNGHQTTWRGVSLRCVACLKMASGWQCSKCSYNYCTQCSKTAKKNDQCPNGHVLKWKATKQMPCQLCNLLELGMTCQECQYRICQKCRPIAMQPQKCPNQHPTIWRPITSEVRCSKCNLQSSGYSCLQCRYHLCSVCSRIKYKLTGQEFCPNGHNQIRWQREVNCLFKCPLTDGFMCQSQECGFAICRRCFGYKPQPKRCPNNHLMPWVHDKQVCLICQNEGYGWKCQQCSYFCCSECSHTELKGITCPNFHTKTWKPTKSQCLVCYAQDKYGWSCQKCRIFTCDACQKTNLLDGRCPNGDTLCLSQLQNTCVVCGHIGRCMQCQKCAYYGCFKCLKKKLNRISCPNSHYIKIQNYNEVRKCEACGKFVEEIYECREKCLPVCQSCIKWK